MIAKQEKSLFVKEILDFSELFWILEISRSLARLYYKIANGRPVASIMDRFSLVKFLKYFKPVELL